MRSQKYKKSDTVVCPICGNDDPFSMGFGETDMTAYYSCTACGHDFMIDMNKMINDESKEANKAPEESRAH